MSVLTTGDVTEYLHSFRLRELPVLFVQHGVEAAILERLHGQEHVLLTWPSADSHQQDQMRVAHGPTCMHQGCVLMIVYKIAEGLQQSVK